MESLLSVSAKVKRGDKVGSLTVAGHPFWVRIRRHERISHVVVECDCGKRVICPVAQLTREKKRKKTCGCRIGTQQWQHGESGTRLFKIYNGIRQRCFNENRTTFKDYGGRGITLCDEWNSDYHAFKAWSLANGYRDDLTIDRIENDKGYEPGNCRWVPMIVQANNSRHNVMLTAFGETKSVAMWARDPRCKASYWSLLRRVKMWKHLQPEVILSRPRWNRN